MMTLLLDYWPAVFAVLAVLFALWWHGCYEREEGKRQGRAEMLREIYGPRTKGGRP